MAFVYESHREVERSRGYLHQRWRGREFPTRLGKRWLFDEESSARKRLLGIAIVRAGLGSFDSAARFALRIAAPFRMTGIRLARLTDS
jgi:hypothetical protein